LQFAQATDYLTLGSYMAFKKICTPCEWGAFEARILSGLCSASEGEQVKIRMHRGEYEQAALALFGIDPSLLVRIDPPAC